MKFLWKVKNAGSDWQLVTGKKNTGGERVNTCLIQKHLSLNFFTHKCLKCISVIHNHPQVRIITAAFDRSHHACVYDTNTSHGEIDMRRLLQSRSFG